MDKRKWYFFGFLFVLLIIHLFFWIYAQKTQKMLMKDSTDYLQQSVNIGDGKGWYCGNRETKFDPDLVSRRPPVYGSFVFVVKSVLHTNAFLTFIQCLISIASFWLIVKLLGKWGKATEGNLLIIAALILFFPTQFIYSNVIMSELLFQSCILLGFYFLLMFFENKNPVWYIYMQIALSLGILTKPILFLFWIPAIFFGCYLLIRKQIPLIAATFSVLPGIVVFIICVHNENKTGYFQYSSVERTNGVNYNIFLTLNEKFSETEANKRIEEIMRVANTKNNYKDCSEYIEKESRKIVMENPLTYLWIETKGMVNFFIDHGRFDLYTFFDKTPEENMKGWQYYFRTEGISGVWNYLKQFSPLLIIYLSLMILINILIAIACGFFIFDRRIKIEIRIFWILIVFYLAFVTGPIGAARFRMPVYPLLIFASMFGLEKILPLPPPAGDSRDVARNDFDD